MATSKTAADYVAAIAAAQNAWKSAAGNTTAQKSASAKADQVRKAAAAAGVNLNGYGTANSYGTDYTKPQGSGMNNNGTPNTTGLKDLGYGFSSTGNINTSPWKADTYNDSVRIIGKSSTDWNAQRTKLLDQAYKTNDWSAYNAFDAQGKAANPTISPMSTTMSNPTSNLSGFIDSQTGLINQIYDNQRAAELQKIRENRDIQLQGLNKIGTQAEESATAQRSQVAAADIQAAQRLREAMAQGGTSNSGDNLTAASNLNTQRQASMGQVNQNLAQVKQDVAERQKLINDAAANNDLALLQQLQAQQSQDLLQLGYQADDRNFRNNQFDWQKQMDTSGLTGNFNNQRTLQGQQLDFNQTQQQWENRYNYGQATGTFQNGQQTLEARQANIGNLWNVADATGTIPDQLADMYRIPRGTKTQAARQWAASYGLQQDQQNYDWSKLESDMLGGSSKYSGLTPNQAISSLQEKYGSRTAVPSGTMVDELDASGYPTGRKVEGNKYVYQTTNDPAKREQMYLDIVSMQLESDAAEQQVMLGAGLTQKEIEAFDKKYLKY